MEVKIRIDRIEVRFVPSLNKYWAGMDNFNFNRIHVNERFYRQYDRLLEGDRLARLTADARLQVRAAFVLATHRGEYEGQPEQAIEALRPAMLVAEKIEEPALVAEGHLRVAALLMSHDLPAAEW